MQSEPSFDLNRAIQDWRESLAQSPAFRSEDIDELESHLRDSVAALLMRGLFSEEAFMVASKRIGRGDALGMEFTKMNRQAVWFDRMLWVLIGFQISMVVFDTCRIFSVFSALPELATSSVLGLYALFTGAALEGDRLMSSVLAMPLATAVCAMIVWKFSHGPASPARTMISKLLQRPLALGFAFLVLGLSMRLLSTSVYVFMFSEPAHKLMTNGFEVPTTVPIATNVLLQLPQYALCAVLTVFLARRRRCVSQA
jgi:hypothetical protein